MPRRYPDTPENQKKGLKSPCSCFYFRARTGGAIADQRSHLFAAPPAGTCSIWFGVLVLFLNWLLLDCELEAP
jgi:hypothetical protein